MHGKVHVNGVRPLIPYFIHKYISFIEFIFCVIHALNPFVCLLVGRLNTLVLIIQQLWRIYKKKLGHFEINWYKGEKKICLLITKHKSSQKSNSRWRIFEDYTKMNPTCFPSVKEMKVLSGACIQTHFITSTCKGGAEDNVILWREIAT